MAEITLHLRNGVSVPLAFEGEEQWELKDTERLVLVLEASTKRVRAAVNLADFVHLTVEGVDGGDGE